MDFTVVELPRALACHQRRRDNPQHGQPVAFSTFSGVARTSAAIHSSASRINAPMIAPSAKPANGVDQRLRLVERGVDHAVYQLDLDAVGLVLGVVVGEPLIHEQSAIVLTIVLAISGS